MKTQTSLIVGAVTFCCANTSFHGLGAELRVPDQYPSIQEAVDASSGGDVIRIAPLDFHEQIVIVDKTNLTLVGEPGTAIHATSGMAQTLLSYGFNGYAVVAVHRSDVTISCLAIVGENLGESYSTPLNGVDFFGAGGLVTNCIITGFRGIGTTTDTVGRGVHCFNPVSTGAPAVNLAIVNNTFTNNQIAIHLRGDPGARPELLRATSKVQGNTIIGFGPVPDWSVGTWIVCGVAAELTDNNISGFSGTGTMTAAGVAAYDAAAASQNRNPKRFVPLLPIKCEGNTFSTNGQHLLVIGGNESQILDNRFVGTAPSPTNGSAVFLSGTNIVLNNNNFSDVPTGILLVGNESWNPPWPALPPAADVTVVSNRFCEVPETIRIPALATGVQQQGNEVCDEPRPPRTIFVPAEYSTIQQAVDAASAGDTIRLAGGDYMEQVVIVDKTNLTLVGEPGTVLHATSTMTQTVPGATGIPLIGNLRSHVVLEGLTLDGDRMGNLYSGLWIGILFRGSSGIVTNCTIRGFRGSTLTDDGNWRGINVFNGVSLGTRIVHVGVFNSTFENNKYSIVLAGDDRNNPQLLRTTFMIHGNTLTGLGPTADILSYGIFILTGAGGEVKGNTITDHAHAGTTGNSATGVIANDGLFRSRGFFLPMQPLRFEANTFSNNTVHLAAIAANESHVINNIFQATGPGPTQRGLALSGTNILVANNDFSDMPTGIVLFGGETSGGSPEVSLGNAINPKLSANWFCNVPESVQIQPDAMGGVEQGTESCPFRSIFQSIRSRDATPLASVSFAVRSWHDKPVVIESSTNLQHWVPVHTNTMSLPSVPLEVLANSAAPRQFYRARQQ